METTNAQGSVIAARDVDTIYEVPLAFHEQGLDESICRLLGLPQRPADLSRWEEIVRRVKALADALTALAADAEHLLPVIEATRQRDVFIDPYAEGEGDLRPMLLVLDDGAEEAVVREQRGRLQAAASARRVRVESVTTDAPTEVARYASLLLSGTYAAEYLRLGLVEA